MRFCLVAKTLRPNVAELRLAVAGGEHPRPDQVG